MIRKDADQNALLQFAVNFWKTEKLARNAKEIIWQECWLAYDSKFGLSWNELSNYRSKRYVAAPWLAVENVACKYIQATMPNRDWFGLQGRTPMDDNSARFMQAIMQYQHQKTRFRSKFGAALKQAVIFGNVPYQVKWDHHSTPVPDLPAFQQALDQAGIDMMQGQDVQPEMPDMPTQELTLYDGPDFEIGNIFDFVIERSPKVSWERAMRAARFIKGKEYLLELSQPDEFGQQLYEGIEDLEEQINSQENSDSLKKQVESKMGFSIQDNHEGIELIEIWGDFDLPGGVYYKNHVLVIANRTKVVRFEPNPFSHGQYPWQLFRLIPEPNEPYGRGILEPAIGLNDDIQVRMNQVIDANALVINPIYKYVDDGFFDPAAVEIAPGVGIPVRNIQNVEWMPAPSDSSLGFEEINFVLNLFNQVTGADQFYQGQDQRPASATQAAIQSQMSNARDAEIVSHIEEDFLNRIMNMWYRLNQQFMNEQMAIRIAGDPLIQGVADPVTGLPLDASQPAFINIQPADIAGDFDIELKGSKDLMAQSQQVGQMIQVIGMMLQNPQTAMWVKPVQFFNQIFKRIGVNDAWQFIKTPQEVMFEQQQAAAIASATGQASQPGGSGQPGGSSQRPQGGGPGSLPGVQEERPPQPGGSSEAQRSGPSIMA